MRSLQGLLLVSCALTVAAVEVGAGSALYGLVEASVTAELDRALATEAGILASFVEQEGRHLDLEFVEDLDPDTYADPARGAFVRVWQGADQVVYSSPSLAGLDVLDGAAASLESRWLPLEQGRVRLAVLEFEPRIDEDYPLEGETPRLTLALTRSGAELDGFLSQLARLLLAVGAGALLLVIGALWVAIRIGLRPVREISAAIQAVSPDDLSTRMPSAATPAELRPVVEQFNALLGRLEQAFARERSFSSDVAHELRTPLAAVRTALEVATSQERSATEYRSTVDEALVVLGSLETLVGRLFQLTRLEGGTAFPERECLHLGDVALECWEAYVHRAQARELEVQWDVDGEPVCWGSRELLTVALRNLFDNATSYVDPGGRITVTLSGGAVAGATLSVENSGSQVASADLGNLTRRFWRGDRARTAAAEHGGLGLALVERVADALDAQLELGTEQGTFRATLRFPPAPQCAEQPGADDAPGDLTNQSG